MPNIGKIAQIIGPVVDVSFANDAHLPKIFSALEITKENGQKIVLEVQQHLGEDRVRDVRQLLAVGLQPQPLMRPDALQQRDGCREDEVGDVEPHRAVPELHAIPHAEA